MPNRGNDHATDERQIRRREEKVGVERWLEDVFFALGEITFLVLPAFYVLMSAEPNGPLKFAALFAWLALVLAAGTLRGDRVDAHWPPLTPSLLLVRFVYYSAVVLLASYAGAAVDLELASPVATAGVAAALALGSVWAFSRLTARL